MMSSLLEDYTSPVEMSRVKQILPKELRMLLPDSANQNGGGMATANQKRAARKNIKKAARTEKKKRTVAHLPKPTRTARGTEGAKAAKTNCQAVAWWCHRFETRRSSRRTMRINA